MPQARFDPPITRNGISHWMGYSHTLTIQATTAGSNIPLSLAFMNVPFYEYLFVLNCCYRRRLVHGDEQQQQQQQQRFQQLPLSSQDCRVLHHQKNNSRRIHHCHSRSFLHFLQVKLFVTSPVLMFNWNRTVYHQQKYTLKVCQALRENFIPSHKNKTPQSAKLRGMKFLVNKMFPAFFSNIFC